MDFISKLRYLLNRPKNVSIIQQTLDCTLQLALHLRNEHTQSVSALR